eukprot:TRINITY_DN2157_c0_g1_i1.p1 TRINITY_DN2157_c0_g1~~TRINITY_DN2157_c0_g1_i1.p1  ORF type:complete len:108 (-),score=0.66 TRINITY_DN2157_c0_g1_i1:76-399(-)
MKNINKLKEQVDEFKPKLVVVFDKYKAEMLKSELKGKRIKVLSGIDGLCEAATINNADLIVNSVVGMVGLKPTLEAIENGKDVALANKETLVAVSYTHLTLPTKRIV